MVKENLNLEAGNIEAFCRLHFDVNKLYWKILNQEITRVEDIRWRLRKIVEETADLADEREKDLIHELRC